MADRIIDTHPHIASKDTERYPLAPIGGKRSVWSEKRSVDFDELLAAMDEGGVTKAAIVHSSTTYGFDNSYLADSIAGHLDRVTGVFSVDTTAPDAPEMMRKWFARDMTGMRIFVRGSTMAQAWMALDDPVVDPAWRCAEELGISVCTNVVAMGEGVTQLENTLTKYPNIPILIDHLGNPTLDDGPPYNQAAGFFGLARFPNVHVKFTPHSVEIAKKGKATPESFLAKVIGEFGADRVCWGSNFPASQGSFRELVDDARRLLEPFSAEQRDWVMYGTAEKLYPSLKD